MSKRILVLDDDIAVLEAMKTALVNNGFDVKTIGRTYNIFNNIEEFNPHVVIVDFILGGVNGAELCRQIKTNPETRDLPVIIMSAYVPSQFILGCFGCDHFISKPFGTNELLQGINKVLKLDQLA
ncbi:response regulator [Pedobacter sp. P351]|uniref:response regulator n=1 Tax=Pedobacter superstes TaxID=3133441 RepID=UPI00309CFF35